MAWKRKRKVIVCDEMGCKVVIKENATMAEGKGLQFCTSCSKRRRKLHRFLNEPYKSAKVSGLSVIALWIKVTVGEEVVRGILVDQEGSPMNHIVIGRPVFLSTNVGERPFFQSAEVQHSEATHDGWAFKAGGKSWLAECARTYH
jgi:hypothetical protein